METINVLDTTAVVMPPFDITAIRRLIIYHINENITTPVAILPGDLEQFDTVERIETINPHDFRAAYDALRNSKAFADPQSTIDVRWAVHFMDRNGNVSLTAYTDRFGVQGVIDAKVVFFTDPAFHDWLEGRFA